jgi:hypothetical protein
MRITILFILFSFSLIVHAQSDQLANLKFQSIHLGQSTTNEMICVSGLCIAEEIKTRQSIVAKYNLPVDITHYGGVKISSPRYDFYDNQLYQIFFSIACKTDKATACIENVVQELRSQYGLEQIGEIFKVYSDHQAIYSYQFLTDTGAVVEIHREKSSNIWDRPSVKIYEKDLIDAVRISANPNYIPKDLMRVASNGN